MPAPDFECSWWPDIWFGHSLTPCCVEHDLSALDPVSAFHLGACVFSTMAGEHPVAGGVLAVLMTAGPLLWCLIRYGPRGIRKPPRKDDM